ncbi:MAG TPA: amidohydrolase family protein [Labilithrix sp.]|nr:amidohydrolase family protein [Labilithrix sp.]
MSSRLRLLSSVASVAIALLGCGASPGPAGASAPSRPGGAGGAASSPPVVAAAPAIDPASMPRQRAVVLRAARYFDGKADRAVDGGVTVVVENGLITDLGSGSLKAPADAETIDLGDATLLPGFIDAHTHVSFEMGESYYKDAYEGLLRFPAEQAHYAGSYARKLLNAGFTTVRDLGSADQIDVGLRNAISKGLTDGPRMLVAVHAIGSTGGHVDSHPFPSDRVIPAGIDDGVCNGADACRAAVRRMVKYGADVIKIAASGGVLSLADAVDTAQLTPAELSAIVDEAHRLRKRVAAHCHGDTAAKQAIAAGVDSIEHASFLKPDTLALMKDKHVVLVPTLLASDHAGRKIETFPPAIQVKARAAIAARSQMFKDALRAGVTIGFGTDSAVSPHGVNAQEFGLMTGLGMTAAQALRAATSVDAELLGIANETGSLEKGKLADIVAVPGNPLVDIKLTERVTFVMRAGKVYKRADAR